MNQSDTCPLLLSGSQSPPRTDCSCLTQLCVLDGLTHITGLNTQKPVDSSACPASDADVSVYVEAQIIS